jgi:hypothetical protein
MSKTCYNCKRSYTEKTKVAIACDAHGPRATRCPNSYDCSAKLFEAFSAAKKAGVAPPRGAYNVAERCRLNPDLPSKKSSGKKSSGKKSSGKKSSGKKSSGKKSSGKKSSGKKVSIKTENKRVGRPASPAKAYKVGMSSLGTDGQTWVVALNKSSRRYWKQFNP